MDIAREVAALERMSTDQLVRKYAEAFGEATHRPNKAWLVKRIAWRLQASAEGGLSERAKQRAAELADDADLRTHVPPKAIDGVPTRLRATAVHDLPFAADDRLPPPGSLLTREYKGQTCRCSCVPTGSSTTGEVYRVASPPSPRPSPAATGTASFLRPHRRERDA